MQTQESPARKPSLLKRLWRLLAATVIGIIVLAGVATAMLFYYEDEVKAAILKEVNKNLEAEVRINPRNIELTLFSSFPDCSLQFSDLLMLEARKQKVRDTLLYAGRLNLHFNFWDLWKGTYRINQLSLRKGLVKLSVDKSGRPNYLFWKKDTAGTSSPVTFELEDIQFRDCRFRYSDQVSDFFCGVMVQKIGLQGKFSEDRYSLKSGGRVLLLEIRNGASRYLRDKNLDYSLDMRVEDELFSIEKARVALNDLAINVDGTYRSGKNNACDLRFECPDMDIGSILSLLPEKHRAFAGDYISKGMITAKGNFKMRGSQHDLEMSFSMQKAEVEYAPTGARLEDVNARGLLEYSEKASKLNIQNLSFHLAGEAVKANLLLENFKKPRIRSEVIADFDLENVYRFCPIDTITALAGKLNLQCALEGDVGSLKNEFLSEKVRLELKASVKDLAVSFKNDSKNYKVPSCDLVAGERGIKVNNLRLERGETDFLINGRVPGLFNYLADNKAPLNIFGDLYCRNLNLDDLILASSGAKSTNTSPTGNFIPANLNLVFDYRMDRFSFGKFRAGHVNGKVEIARKKAIISDARFETLKGSAEVDAFLDNSDPGLNLVLQSKVSKVDINQLFAEMNNFGQTTLQDKHIRGLATATIDFSGHWNAALVSDPSAIKAEAELLVENGELIEFKPLLSLGRFVAIEELNRIRFNSLQSHINISNSLISLPKTSIKNTALNVDIWGSHTFNNEIDYHIQLLLSDLLARRRKVKDEDFGVVANDPNNRRSAFILMKGTVDNHTITFDKQGFRKKVKEDLTNEKQNVRLILKEEIGLFRKDTALKAKQQPPPEFKLETNAAPPKPKELERKKRPAEEDF